MALPYTSHLTIHARLLPLEHADPPCLMSPSSDSFGSPKVKASVSYLTLATSSLSLSSSPSPRSSLYLAVRLRSLVDSFRKRVKRREHVAKRRKADDTTFCRDIEREAYGAIDQYLGRRPKRATVVRLREGAKKAIASDGAVLSHDKVVNVKKSLANINRAADLNNLPLSTLAAHDELFLSRKANLFVKRLSINELQHLIVNVRDLLDTLHHAVKPHSSALTLPSDGSPAEFVFEPAYLANLTHLLLCLQSQLLCQLIHCCVELVRAHILECQRTHQRSCEDWFFEYPDARHPLSTTWPWAIKPSLAVLWGVCWMFADPAIFWDQEGNVLDPQGRILVSSLELAQLNSDPAFVRDEQQQNIPQRTQQRSIPTSSYRVGSQNMSSVSVLYPEAGAYPPQRLGARPSVKPRPASSHLPDRAMMGAQPLPATQHQQNRPNNNSSRPLYSAHAIQYQAPGSHLGLVPANSNTPYSAAQPAAHSVAGGPGSWLPQLPQDANFPIQHPPQGYNAYLEQPSVYQQQWQGPNHASQEHLLVPQPAHTRGNTAVQTHCSPLRRSRSTGQVTPVIRVTTEQPNTPDSQVQPQDSHHTSATSLYANYDYEIPAYLENSIHYPQQLNPKMADIQVQPQVGPSNGIASPISDHPDLSRPISPAPMTDPNLRKRSFSEMSQGPPHMQMVVPTDQQSPQGVAYETSPNGVEDGGHKVQRMIKRGDPPQAHDGKYYCNYAPECADQYFDRKCEWSKHMDKHDRPYRCPQPQCAKLQGFTYSGGLLRHEREVHGKHGGPKEQLRCTVPDCKRHSGKGFTRKENLNEHLRRVHGITSTTDTAHLRQIAADAAPGSDMIETPGNRFSDTGGEVDEFNAAPSAYPDLANSKRRRLDTSVSGGSDDLEVELHRLKADNREKDERIRGLEEKDAEREARLKSLEDRLMELTTHGLHQRVPDEAHMGTYPDYNESVDAMQQAQEP